MRQRLLYLAVLWAACCVVQAQTPSLPPNPSSGQPGDPYSPSGTSGSYGQSDPQSKQFGATGRMGQHEIRASKLTGTELKSPTGESLGTIQDVILNTASGRIEFAVASLQSQSATTPGTQMTGQLVPIPWSLVRPAGVTGYGARSTAGTSASAEQLTLVYTGDVTKLQAAPAFSQTSWPDFSQQSWRHNIYSYYGMTPGSTTGGAESPSGIGTGNERGRYPTTPPGTPRDQ